MATGDGMNVAAELAELRGSMNEGFARIEGRLELIAQSQGQFKEDLSDLEDALGDVEKRVTALEARRWPMGQVVALSGVAGTVAAVATLFVK